MVLKLSEQKISSYKDADRQRHDSKVVAEWIPKEHHDSSLAIATVRISRSSDNLQQPRVQKASEIVWNAIISLLYVTLSPEAEHKSSRQKVS